MRSYQEPTRKNLLRPALILGVPFPGLLALVVVVVVIQTLGQGTAIGDGTSCGAGIIGYAILRILSRIGKPGWDEVIVFWMEQASLKLRQIRGKKS